MKVFKLQVTPEAIIEIQEAIDYYNSKQKELGKKFYTALKKQFTSIKDKPFARAIRYDEVRFASLEKFPYAAHYTINDKTIIIQAVLSEYRNPEVYRKRKIGKSE